MLSGLRCLHRSFSFRLTLLCFALFLSVLLILRLVMYKAVVGEAQTEALEVLEQQLRALEDDISVYGLEHGLREIEQTIQNDYDNKLIISYQDGSGKTLGGNLILRPEYIPKDDKPMDIYISSSTEAVDEEEDEEEENYRYMTRAHRYSDGAVLLVGYDLRHLQGIERIMGRALVSNVFVSLITALVSAAAITMMVSRSLSSINRACQSLVQGDLKTRARVNNSGDEFDQLSMNFNYMLEWIERLIINTKGAAESIAHDMRTPLSRHRIKLHGIMKSAVEVPDIAEQINDAISDIDRISRMFDAILKIAAAESKSAVESFTAFDLPELVEGIADIYADDLEEKNIRFDMIFPARLRIKGDRQLIGQAVANIMDNAVKYTPMHGNITLEVKKSGVTAEVIVSDDGQGIPEHLLDKVKERFFRVDASRHEPGTGLGLSLVEAVSRLHNGRFTLQNTNPGLKVRLVFPIHD